MPKSQAKKGTGKGTRRSAVSAGRRAKTNNVAHKRPRKITVQSSAKQDEYACVVERGQATFVLVPVEEYEELIKASMVKDAIALIESSKDSDFVDADDFALELAAERIAKARKAKGLTQKELGEKLKLPQSQISRIERNPDRTTIRTLKRIARVLGVDVSALV